MRLVIRNDSIRFLLRLGVPGAGRFVAVLGQVDEKFRIGLASLVAGLFGDQLELATLHHFPLLLHALLFRRVIVIRRTPGRGLVERSQVVAVRQRERGFVQFFLHVDGRLA